MARDDTILLVISRSISSELENLCSEVFQDGSKVDRSSRSDAFGIPPSLQVASEPANGKLEASLDSLGYSFFLGDLSAASLAALSYRIHGYATENMKTTAKIGAMEQGGK